MWRRDTNVRRIAPHKLHSALLNASLLVIRRPLKTLWKESDASRCIAFPSAAQQHGRQSTSLLPPHVVDSGSNGRHNVATFLPRLLSMY
jgi:hypothetical protein